MTTLTTLPTNPERTTTLPPPGWYPDPIGTNNWLRYWDGSTWTAETALMALRVDGRPDETAADAQPDETPLSDPQLEDRAAVDPFPTATPALDFHYLTPREMEDTKRVLDRGAAPRPVYAGASGTWLLRGAIVAVCVAAFAAIVATAGSSHAKTTHKARSLSPAVPAAAAAPLTVQITAPTDGQSVQARSVVIRGVVSRSDARVTVNGRRAHVRGRHFSLRMPVHPGDNGFDVAADGQDAASVLVLGPRTAAERVAPPARNAAPQAAAQQPTTTSATVSHPTYYRSSGYAPAKPSAGTSADADMGTLPPRGRIPSGSGSTTEATPAPTAKTAPTTPTQTTASPAPDPSSPTP
jgi:hypothetical protein